MMNYKQYAAETIASCVPEWEWLAEDIVSLMETPPDPEMGDLSLPCYRLSRTLRRPPHAIAAQIGQRLRERLDPGTSGEPLSRIDAAGGYVNLFINRAHLARTVVAAILQQGARYGTSGRGEGRTVVIDFSSPNIAKPFHVAHLRSTVIGNALYRLFASQGYKCVGINHLGDWGTQFGKLIVAYRLWGVEERIREGGIDELLRLYVRFHEEAEKDPALEDGARLWFVRMERGDEEALALWRKFVELSMEEFGRMYRMLGVEFDHVTGESFYNGKMEPVIRLLRDKGLLEEDEGASLVRLEPYGMPPALMLKKDGSSLYHTRDIAAALYRKETFDFDKAVYVTDYAQQLHFRQWFKVVELLGYPWASDLVHVAFGRVSIEGAALSTRRGHVVKLDEVLRQSVAKAKEIMETKNPGLENKDEVAAQVGVGAVIFHDLIGNRMKDIDFSWEKALAFEGETGPYVQWTHARACSVLRKAGGTWSEGKGKALFAGELQAALLASAEEVGVLMELYRFRERVAEAADKLEPSIVARALVDLAQAFNRFYYAYPILANDADVRGARLALTGCVRQTLRNGLKLLGIAAPERM